MRREREREREKEKEWEREWEARKRKGEGEKLIEEGGDGREGDESGQRKEEKV